MVPASRAVDLAASWRDIARDRREGRAAGFGWAERPRTMPPECDSTSEARSCSLGAQELPAWALLLLSRSPSDHPFHWRCVPPAGWRMVGATVKAGRRRGGLLLATNAPHYPWTGECPTLGLGISSSSSSSSSISSSRSVWYHASQNIHLIHISHIVRLVYILAGSVAGADSRRRMWLAGVLSCFEPSAKAIAQVPGQSAGPTPVITPSCQPGATTILRQVREHL